MTTKMTGIDQIREIKITFAERSFWYLNDGHFGRRSFWITIILIFDNGHFRSLSEMYRSNYLKWAVVSYTSKNESGATYILR